MDSETKQCEENGCEARARARGYCQRHYKQRRRRGELARVRTVTRWMTLTERMAAQTDRGTDGLGHGPMGCWRWTGPTNGDGYGKVTVNGRPEGAHRVALWRATGVKPTGFVLHSCDNPRCVNPAHLREGTHAENMREMAERGRHGRTKLTAADVVEIRRRAGSGEPQRVIARDFGVSHVAIGMIVRGRTWVHVASEVDPPLDAAGAAG